MKLLERAAAALLLSASVAAELAYAQSGSSIVHLALTPEPPMLMQGISQNTPTNMVAGNIYEGLLRYDQKLQPQPSLAQSWEVSTDGKTYTFRLQRGVKWHDGKPFTSGDVVFSLDKFLREVNPRWRPIANGQVEKIEAIDANTVRIKLKQPFAPLLTALEVASAPMVPKHIYDGTSYRDNPANATPIGTGPYKLKEWRKGAFIHLVKNPDYWIAGRPRIDELYWQIIPDASARAVAYETGKIDVLTSGSVDVYDVQRLSKLPNSCMTTTGWEMAAPIAWLSVNHRNGPLGDKSFRQAMMFAIDREYGKETVFAGLGKVPTGPVSTKTRFYSSDVTRYTYDPARAKKLLAASKYKGETIRLLKLPYGEVWDRYAEAVKQNLQDVGIKVELISADAAGWSQRVANWDFDLTFNFLYQLGDPAIGVARTYVSSNIVKGNPFANVGGYSNPEVDALFAQAATSTSDDQRQRQYAKAQQILTEDLPVLWLLEMEQPTIYRCNIKDLFTTALGINDGFREAYKVK